MILRAATTAGWFLVAMIGAACIATLALHRGETINAIWMVAAAISVFAIAYRFYARFIAHTGLGIDPTRATPAHRRNDGLDYVPTDRHVLFGHHFAAIAGAGPLVGPILAVQMGYLPRTLWILAGVVFSGAWGQRMEVMELPGHPFFLATQFHPEFRSRPARPSPPFVGFVRACRERRQTQQVI